MKPSVTYRAEVVSFPENFFLRYWSSRPEDGIVLQYHYASSAGVNVFVGSADEPDTALRLARSVHLTSLMLCRTPPPQWEP